MGSLQHFMSVINISRHGRKIRADCPIHVGRPTMRPSPEMAPVTGPLERSPHLVNEGLVMQSNYVVVGEVCIKKYVETKASLLVLCAW